MRPLFSLGDGSVLRPLLPFLPPVLPDRARLNGHTNSSRHSRLPMAARELRIAARKGDCGKLRELLDGGAGASVVDERTEVTDDVTGQRSGRPR